MGPKPPKIELRSGLGVYWEVLGATWGLLGRSGGILSVLVRSWRHLWWNLGHLGRVWEPLGNVLGLSWGVLGGSWGVLGSSCRLPGTILEVFFKDFLASQAVYENSEKHGKTNGFSLIFKVLEGFRLPKIIKKSQKDRS